MMVFLKGSLREMTAKGTTDQRGLAGLDAQHMRLALAAGGAQ
ncbi:hypothetical protein BJB45_17825 [Halomonas huangheensis]|uniref:Uncharacterized protein n=1 Tax=Halomonas huangheensis TaxID=1178482 RepID=W1NDA0_9GAMM|nr:hypothetical protein BJB45_17825 [Halomonas huangheensis]